MEKQRCNDDNVDCNDATTAWCATNGGGKQLSTANQKSTVKAKVGKIRLSKITSQGYFGLLDSLWGCRKQKSNKVSE